ncbi:MAG: hypothetical protein NC397_02705 [Clostridium sp.]|nr:hypothetical protein [Clostridium sp.]
MKFKIFGIEIIIEYSFFLMLSFAIVLGADDVADLLLYSSLHELGHLSALFIFKGKPDSLKLSYYGLALRYSCQLSIVREAVVLLAGPMVNLVLYFIFKNDINLMLFAINMLPIYPIDFGRVIRLFSYKASKVLSFDFLILLIVIAIYLLIFYHSFSMIFIACYLIIYSLNY